MMESLAAAGIPALDVTSAMRIVRFAGKESLFFEYDVHLRPAGHAAVAEALERWLVPCIDGSVPSANCLRRRAR